ncbi:MAG: sigma-E processing peptidase SpoIIGA [Clostridia bacterium]
MKVYLDYILLENLIVNISIFYQISIFSKTKTKFLKIILMSIFLSIIAVVNSLEILNVLILQILSVNIAIYYIYKPKKNIEYFKYQVYFYGISMIYIGIIISTSLLFNITLNSILIRIILYITSSIVTYIVNKYIYKGILNKIKYFNLTYKIIFEEMNNCTFNVFVDTGNSLKDHISNLDVIVLNENNYSKKVKNIALNYKKNKEIKIDIVTASGRSDLKGYVFKNVVIKKGVIEKVRLKKVIVLFIKEEIKNNEYDGILSYDTYLNKLGD